MLLTAVWQLVERMHRSQPLSALYSVTLLGPSVDSKPCRWLLHPVSLPCCSCCMLRPTLYKSSAYQGFLWGTVFLLKARNMFCVCEFSEV